MYYQCIHQRLYHLTPAEYEDFTGIILHARKVLQHPIFLPLISPSRLLCGRRVVRTSSKIFSPLSGAPRAARRTCGQRSQLRFRVRACLAQHNRNHFWSFLHSRQNFVSDAPVRAKVTGGFLRIETFLSQTMQAGLFFRWLVKWALSNDGHHIGPFNIRISMCVMHKKGWYWQMCQTFHQYLFVA